MERNAFAEENIGLVNVNQRIRLFYGEGYGIRITSRIGEGTEIIISLPVRNCSENMEKRTGEGNRMAYKVWIVDDEGDCMQGPGPVCQMAGAWVCGCGIANSVDEALLQLEHAEADVIFSGYPYAREKRGWICCRF